MVPHHELLSPDEVRQSAFRRLGDDFVATPWAGGPWDERYCHGGAVAALLVRAIEKVPSLVPMGLARMGIDLFAPVPVGVAIATRCRLDKDGAKLQRIAVDLVVEGRIVATGSIVRIRASTPTGLLAPSVGPDVSRVIRGSPGGFARSFDIVPERGGIAVEGPGRVWFRLSEPLVEGEAANPDEAAVAIADFTSAIGMSRDYRHFTFPSVDLTVGLARSPLGEWIRVDAFNSDGDEGRATCFSTLCDADGIFGHVVQTNFIEPRAEPLA